MLTTTAELSKCRWLSAPVSHRGENANVTLGAEVRGGRAGYPELWGLYCAAGRRQYLCRTPAMKANVSNTDDGESRTESDTSRSHRGHDRCSEVVSILGSSRRNDRRVRSRRGRGGRLATGQATINFLRRTSVLLSSSLLIHIDRSPEPHTPRQIRSSSLTITQTFFKQSTRNFDGLRLGSLFWNNCAHAKGNKCYASRVWLWTKRSSKTRFIDGP